VSRRIAEVRRESEIGTTISLRGWVHRLRKQKEKTFIILRDDRGDVIQAICPSNLTKDLTIESSVELTGRLEKDDRAIEGGYELKVNKIIIFNIAATDYPIGEYQSDEILLDYRHLTLRTRKLIAVGKLRGSLLKYCRNWFDREDWMEVTPPLLVKGAVEGGATLFEVKYFDNTAYLSQSSQLYLEAMIYSLGPVWTISPSFRAERSRTVRHLAEFSHLEAEIPWIGLSDLILIQERLICYIINMIKTHNGRELNFLSKDALKRLEEISPPFEKITYGRAIDILRSLDCKIKDQEGKERNIEWGDDLNTESERELTKDRTSPIFVTEYPLQIKPFYVKQNPSDESTGLAVDLLAPHGFGEIAGGGIREDDLSSLRKRIEQSKLKIDDYLWYLDLRKYGSVPHGGFGLGIERFLRWILNFDDIKDVALFPRTMSRILP
jgi:asparaginyl-tRNA synthetase